MRTATPLFLLITLNSIVVSGAKKSANVTAGELMDLIMGDLFKRTSELISIAEELTDEGFSRLIACKEKGDACKKVPEIIRSQGFKVEEHEVVTRDGYILTLHRVINPLVEQRYRRLLRPVILQHGFPTCSIDWVFGSPDVGPMPWPCNQCNEPFDMDPSNDQQHPRSLAYYLVNEGFDVWLANSRGNTYSQSHISKSTIDPSFWDFSFDEQIDYDLPDTILYIQINTSFEKIAFVGHSLGSLIMFGLLSDQPKYADIIEPFVALAPVVYLHNTKSMLSKLLPLELLSGNIKIGLLAGELGRYVIRQTCQFMDCVQSFYNVYGYDPDAYDHNRTQILNHHLPSGTSYRNMMHFGQLIFNKNFTRYNYGLSENLIRHGQALPPIYDLGKIKSKSIVIFNSKDDLMADQEDVNLLIQNLRVKPFERYVVSRDLTEGRFNHIHFLYGKYSGVLVNKRVVKILKLFRKKSKLRWL